MEDAASLAGGGEAPDRRPDERERLSREAFACVDRFTGALDRTLDALEPYLAELATAMKLAARLTSGGGGTAWRATRSAPLGALYGRISARRMAVPGMAVGIPVICVGNFVVGGAGKTPTAIEMAGVCRGLGLEPGFLSRGYMAPKPGRHRVLHRAHRLGRRRRGAAARSACEDGRVAEPVSGARLLVSLGVDAIVMDDGFQNPSLVKDLSLVLSMESAAIGNGRVLPAGPLRAPLAAPDPPRRARSW